MSILYDLVCRNCGKESCAASDGEFVLHNGKEVNLPHPCEDEKLKELNLTREKAALRGQLFLDTAYVCSACGSVRYVKSLILPTGSPPSKTELIIWTTFLLIVFTIVIFSGLSIVWAGVAFAISMLLLTLGKEFVLQKWVLHKFGFTEEMKCNNCQSTQLVKMGEYLRVNKANLLCEECGKREIVCTGNAIS